MTHIHICIILFCLILTVFILSCICSDLKKNIKELQAELNRLKERYFHTEDLAYSNRRDIIAVREAYCKHIIERKEE